MLRLRLPEDHDPIRRIAQPALLDRALRGGLAWIGAAVTAVLSYFGQFAIFGNALVQYIMRGEVTRRETFQQMALVGVDGLPLVALTVGFSGLVFGVYTVAQFQRFGAADQLGMVVSMSMTREVAPVLVATVIAARSGSAIAAEAATMKITEQLDALRSLATDPIQFLGVPRYMALVLMLPLLTLVGDVCGTLAAGAMGTLHGISWRQYIGSIQANLPFDHVVHGMIKAAVFGALIAIASLLQGFRCGFGTQAVGRATTQAVVLDIIWIHFANLIIAASTN